jgi:hypothetical protein
MNRTFLVVAIGLVLVTGACSGESTPTAPTPPPVAACQSQNTATVYFQNRSTSNLTYDIVWDGARLTTVGPAQNSQTYTVVANVPHLLRFQVTNLALLACSQGTPTLTTCSNNFYFCAK